jgi:hypothetical protein
MVLFQFPFGAVATHQININDSAAAVQFPQRTEDGEPYVPPVVDPPDPGNPLVDFPRIQQGVFHSFSNRKVHIKIIFIAYTRQAGGLQPPQDLYRIDFYNMQMIGSTTVAQGNGAQGSHCSHGICFSNNISVNGSTPSFPIEFDAWLHGPLLIADILPHNVIPGDFCPLVVSDGLAHALIMLDVTLLE